MQSRPVVLSIAGYDPSSGAGITADVKTAGALGCYAVTCMTALTVQSTQGVFGVQPVAPKIVRETLERLAEDVDFAAVRIGMLGTGAVAKVVAEFLARVRTKHAVLDPVLVSSSGAALLDAEGIDVIRNALLRLCEVVTPNFEEAVLLAGASNELMARWKAAGPTPGVVGELAERLHTSGSRAVVITGGDSAEVVDYLSISDGQERCERTFAGEKVVSRATHGTGCAFATALACGLAHGRQLETAVAEAKRFVRDAVASAYPVGKGAGPTNHLFRLG